jgi:hypothetical protein
MLLALLFAQPLIIGIVAQKIFKRTGIIWALIAFSLNVALGLFLDNAIKTNPRWNIDAEYRANINTIGHEIAFILMTVGVCTVFVLIVLSTLPKRKP